MGDLDLISGLGTFTGGGHGNPLQYSCLGIPMDRGAWSASSWGSKESDTTERLSPAHTIDRLGIGMFIIPIKLYQLVVSK